MRHRYTDDGQPSSPTMTRMYDTAAIMNATPPGEPATCDGVVRGESRIARAQPGRQADERKAHEDDARRR